MRDIPVTVIVLTHNEELNIRKCLRSLIGFSDVIVVDSGSTDATLQIVKDEFPTVRVFARSFSNFGDQRNWALDESSPRHAWVLFVDADEFMEQPLADEIARFVPAPGEAIGGYIAGRNYFMGKWLKRCTFFPSYQLRLLKRGCVRYRQEGHGQREVMEGSAVYFRNSWYHDAFSHGIDQWISRHNRYSTDEVHLIRRLRGEKVEWRGLLRSPVERRRTLKQIGARLPLRWVARIVYTYFLRGGFLDGIAGFWFCMLRFTHEIHIAVKLRIETHQSRNEGRPEKR